MMGSSSSSPMLKCGPTELVPSFLFAHFLKPVNNHGLKLEVQRGKAKAFLNALQVCMSFQDPGCHARSFSSRFFLQASISPLSPSQFSIQPLSKFPAENVETALFLALWRILSSSGSGVVRISCNREANDDAVVA